MGIVLALIGFALFYIGWILQDIKIELKYRNTLAEKQNEILETKLKI